MDRVTADEVPSRAYRVLQVLLFAPVAYLALSTVAFFAAELLGLGASGAGGTAGAAGATGVGYGSTATSAPLTGVGVVGVLAFLGAVVLSVGSSIAIPILLYFDAKTVADIDIDWKPNPTLYAVLGLFLSGLALAYYLYKRDEYVIGWVGSGSWWYVSLAGLVALFVGLGLTTPVSLAAGFVVFGVGAVLYTVGIYRDAGYVRLNSDWRPNPTEQYVAAALTVLLWFAAPFYVGYYGWKRYRSVGLT